MHVNKLINQLSPKTKLLLVREADRVRIARRFIARGSAAKLTQSAKRTAENQAGILRAAINLNRPLHGLLDTRTDPSTKVLGYFHIVRSRTIPIYAFLRKA